MPDTSDIESLLGPEAELSAEERARIVRRLEAGMAAAPAASPYSFIFTRTSMIPLAIALIVLLGAGGTVAASDSARPGDLLFPLDRAVEDARLALASEDDKLDLRIRFADERLREFESVADDALDDDLSGRTLTEAEADIFTNETIVKVEAGDRKAVFSTDADTREEIIDAIAARFGFAKADIDAVLDVETEDRASRADDGAQVSDDDRRRIGETIDILSGFIADLGSSEGSEEARAALLLIEDRLTSRSSSLPSDLRVRLRGDEGRFEIRGEDGRVRVEIKDGEVRVKTDDDDHDKGFGNDDRDDDDRGDDSSALSIEADIFDDTTIVKVELNDRTTVFETDADSRSEVIDAVEARFPGLSESEIDAALRLETEDRASRADDRDDSSDDDSSGKNDDDDEDDDKSGSGSGHDSDDDDDDRDDDDSSGHGSGHD